MNTPTNHPVSQAETLTPAQSLLRDNHGTPAEFAAAVLCAVPGFVSMDEATAAICKYCREWEAANTQAAGAPEGQAVRPDLIDADGMIDADATAMAVARSEPVLYPIPRAEAAGVVAALDAAIASVECQYPTVEPVIDAAGNITLLATSPAPPDECGGWRDVVRAVATEIDVWPQTVDVHTLSDWAHRLSSVLDGGS